MRVLWFAFLLLAIVPGLSGCQPDQGATHEVAADSLRQAAQASWRRMKASPPPDPKEHEANVNRAIVLARQAGTPEYLLDGLIASANVHVHSGRDDSVEVRLIEALQLAEELSLWQRTASTAYTLSHHFFRQGHEGLAAELRETAAESYRRSPGNAVFEIESLLRVLSIHFGYENWSLARRDLDRVRTLLPTLSDSLREVHTPYVDLLEAQLWMKQGEFDRAQNLFERLDPHLAVLDIWAGGLLEHERADLARSVAQRGLDQLESQRASFFEARFLRHAIRAAIQSSRWAEGDSLLSRLRNDTPKLGDPWFDFFLHLVECEWANARGQFNESDASLERAREALDQSAGFANTGASQHVLRVRTEQLRRTRRHVLSHRGNDPWLTYRMWFDDPERSRQIVEWTKHSSDRVHLLFATQKGQTYRWRVQAGTVQCDTLAVTPDELFELVRHATVALGSEPEDVRSSLEPSLQSRLRTLGRHLIPADLATSSSRSASLAVQEERSDDRTGRVLLSSTGILRELPFECLSTDDGEYVPWNESRNIAYFRMQTGTALPNRARYKPAPDPSGHTWSGGLVAADPDLAVDILRHYPGLHDLEGSRAEIQHLKRFDPAATLLTGSDLTKEALERHWTEAPYLYFAAHVVRDPENPTWTFLPLSRDLGHSSLADSRLETVDILAHDLSQCRLVVLSGCESGVPHVTHDNLSPSLADAFLDAGAHSVVQTFWKIRDDLAVEMMREFQDLWLGKGYEPDLALNSVRKRAIERGVHPFYWGAFGIQHSRP